LLSLLLGLEQCLPDRTNPSPVIEGSSCWNLLPWISSGDKLNFKIITDPGLSLPRIFIKRNLKWRGFGYEKAGDPQTAVSTGCSCQAAIARDRYYELRFSDSRATP